MNATMHFVVWGVLPIGALVGGFWERPWAPRHPLGRRMGQALARI